jgi:hypothetical protein
VIIPFARRPSATATVVLAAAASACALGVAAAVEYHRLGLTLSHYDARGHLVVARRIADSITPGWQQIGAVWLPLPHLLNALPVQNDFLYRTGASGVAISMAAFVAAAGAIAWIVAEVTGSGLAALTGAAVFILNPNVLYLQATPMTEPLLLALTALAVAALMTSGRDPIRLHAAGALFALACLTRYEAWPVTAVALALAVWVRWREGCSAPEAVHLVSRVAVYPFLAIVGFAIFSRTVIGEWFVGSDFFVPENKARGDLWLAVKEIGWGTRMLSSAPLVWLGLAGLVAAAGMALRRRAAAILTLALSATAATPLVAFYKGHPFRIRYMVPLLAAEAIGAGVAAGAVRPARMAASGLVLVAAVAALGPLDASAPMVVEAQWDRPNVPARASITACLGRPRAGGKIMASMGSLGHYMQETSLAGFELRDFLHEGNGDIWLSAIETPRPFARWVLIEEKAEGGDMLARIAREHPHFLDGYSRVCDGAGLALYRRDDPDS